MKTLLINQAFVSPDEPGHTRHYELAQYLRKHGHELVIVGSDLNYQTGKRIIQHRGLSVDQDIDGVHVIRAAIVPSLHRSYFWRIISFVSFMVSSLVASLKVRDVDLVMGTTPPIFQAASVWLIACIRRKPFLLEVRDLWPEFGVGMGVLKNPVIIWMARRLEDFLYSRADKILVNSPAYVDYMLGRGVAQEKIAFIPYGTALDNFNPQLDGTAFRKKLGLTDKFVVLYAGALGQANDIHTLLRAASRIKEDNRIRILLLGDGKEKASLQMEARRLELSNVIFADPIPKKEMPQALAAADVCLAILQDIPAFRTTYPNKVFDYMAAGKPTVLVIDGVIRQVMQASAGGVFVPPGDDAYLAQTLVKVSRDSKSLNQMGAAARCYMQKNMNRQDKMAETMRLMEGMLPR